MESEYFKRPVCMVIANSEAEATEKVFNALSDAGIEIRRWA